MMTRVALLVGAAIVAVAVAAGVPPARATPGGIVVTSASMSGDVPPITLGSDCATVVKDLATPPERMAIVSIRVGDGPALRVVYTLDGPGGSAVVVCGLST